MSDDFLLERMPTARRRPPALAGGAGPRPAYREEAPFKIHGGCGLMGICDESGALMPADIAVRAMAIQRDRGNGLGAGFAGYGIYPEFPDHFCFHLMFHDERAREEVEAILDRSFVVDQAEPIPTRPFGGASGKNMGAFKGVAFPEEIAHFFRLERVLVGEQEVAPKERHVGGAAEGARGDRLRLVDHERAVEDRLDLLPCALIVEHQVKAEVVGELRVDAVPGEAGAEAVAAIALDSHGAHGDVGGHQRPGLVADAHEAAAAVDLEGRLLAIGWARAGAAGKRRRAAPRGGHALQQKVVAHRPATSSSPAARLRSRATASPPLAGSGSSPSLRRALSLGVPSVPCSRNVRYASAMPSGPAPAARASSLSFLNVSAMPMSEGHSSWHV